jgi:hypothetical protein
MVRDYAPRCILDGEQLFHVGEADVDAQVIELPSGRGRDEARGDDGTRQAAS